MEPSFTIIWTKNVDKVLPLCFTFMYVPDVPSTLVDPRNFYITEKNPWLFLSL